MPILDNDLLTINRATRSGATNIEILATWVDGTTGENKGTFGVSWADTAEFRAFLESQDFDGIMRIVMLQCINRDTGSLRPTVFDNLAGKTFRVRQQVTQV